MAFEEILVQVLHLLQREGRVSYRALKLRFNLDDDYLEALKDEIIEAKQQAVDENGKVLVWTGGAGTTSTEPVLSPGRRSAAGGIPPGAQAAPEAERRQLTVLFCDLNIQRHSQDGWTPKNSGRWCEPTRRPVPRSSSVLTGTLRNISAMACWSTMVIPRHMKMMHNGPYAPASAFSRPLRR